MIEAVDNRSPFEELAAAEEVASGQWLVAGEAITNCELRITNCGTQNSELRTRNWDFWGNLAELVEFARTRPAAWRTVEARLRDPEASYSELARATGISKMSVHRHLSEAAGELPMLRPLLRRRK